MSDPKGKIEIAGVEINRRNVLLGGAGAAGVGAVGLSGTFLFSTPARIVDAIVRDHLPGLNIADADMAQFVADFLAADRETSRTEMLALRLMAPFVNMPPFRWMVPGFVNKGLENYQRRIMNEFMMATDFFETYAQGNMTVSYYGIYSVYEAPCANPLPKFPEDSGSA